MTMASHREMLAQSAYDELGKAKSILEDTEDSLKELELPEDDMHNLLGCMDILYGIQVFIENHHGVE
jgi:hypothetical protein